MLHTRRRVLSGVSHCGGVVLSKRYYRDIRPFLAALEDPISRNGRLGVPDRVPSELPLDPISDPS